MTPLTGKWIKLKSSLLGNINQMQGDRSLSCERQGDLKGEEWGKGRGECGGGENVQAPYTHTQIWRDEMHSSRELGSTNKNVYHEMGKPSPLSNSRC